MSSLRTKLSLKSANYISKHRYLELKHFCLQYPEWKKELASISHGASASLIKISGSQVEFNDPTFDISNKMSRLEEKIELVEGACEAVDLELQLYLLEAVTKGISYEYLRSVKTIPCGRRQFYEKYREVFKVLDLIV